jgi:hypothetical protein
LGQHEEANLNYLLFQQHYRDENAMPESYQLDNQLRLQSPKVAEIETMSFRGLFKSSK